MEASFQGYLNSYPQGQYALLAAARIAKLKKDATQAEEYTDPKTGLVWRRCAEGMTYSGNTCTGTASTFTYDEALQQAKSEASRTGIAWRVPEKEELAGLVDKQYSPTIDPAAFPGTPVSWFWSSSPFVGSSDVAWGVDFDDGDVGYDDRTGTNCVRLVGASQ
jgi:hypothetical protein